MSTSVSYDMLTAQEHRRWANLYLVISGTDEPDFNLVSAALWQALPSFSFKAKPSIAVLPAAEAPFETIDANYILAIKWPIRLKSGAPITPEIESEAQQHIRSSINRPLVASGYGIVQFDIERVDKPLTNDQGVPPTPPLPSANIPLWPLIPVALGSILYIGVNKR